MDASCSDVLRRARGRTTGVAKPVWEPASARWKLLPVSQGRHRGASRFACSFLPVDPATQG